MPESDIIASNLKPITTTTEQSGTSDKLMFRRLSLLILGGMTRREFTNFKKFGRESLR